MTQSSGLITLGIIIILLPFLGLPYSFVDTLEPLLGLVVCGIGLSNRLHDVRAQKERASPETTLPPQAM